MIKRTLKPFSKQEPYRIFFLVGLFCAFLGIMMWPLFQWELLSFYPREAHVGLLVFGFFFAFVAGFFMTAVPRMTGTGAASSFEIIVALGMVIAQVFLALTNRNSFQLNLYGLQLGFLAIFLLRRIIEKRKIPFEGFYFLPFALFWAFLAVALVELKIYQSLSAAVPLLVDGFLLNLICGLGSRLLPVISRIPNAIKPDERSSRSRKWSFLISALVLNSSFIFHLLDERHFANLIVGIYLIFHGVIHFSIFERAQQKSVAHFGFKVAVLSMIFAKLINAIPDFNFLALNHVFYIAGIFLLTILVATRVMLAHGSQDLDYEITSKRIRWVIYICVFAGLFRWLAGSDVNSISILVSSFLFLMALVLWGTKYISILISNVLKQ